MSKTALIIGGSGFLGRQTALALFKAGYAVKIYDLEPPAQKLPSEITFIQGDILDRDKLEIAMQDISYVYHLAGIADIETANANPEKACHININGTLNILSCAVKLGIKRLVFASTVYIYSCSGGFYKTTKQTCEHLIQNYNEFYNLPFTILRYGSLYGPGAGDTNGIHKLLESALKDNIIVYNGDPEAVREYIHINDAATLSVEILKEEYENGYYTLTGTEKMKVVDLMRMVSEMLPNKPEIRFGPPTLAAHYVITPYKYAPQLGHKLTLSNHIDLGQGLLQCIDEIYKQNIETQTIKIQ